MVIQPEVKSKLAKIYELVKRGATEGERKAATAALERMIAKYNIVISDFDSLLTEAYQFKYSTKLDAMLIQAIMFYVMNKLDWKKSIKRSSIGKSLIVQLTYLDYITLSCTYEYFKRHMAKEWKKYAAKKIARCRSIKTMNKRRSEMQRLFFNAYSFESGFFHPDEIVKVDLSKLSRKEIAERIALMNIEGGKFNNQVSNGLLIENQ